MYVAITRARKRLYLSFSQTRMLHGQTRYNVASRFFREIPENLMKRVGSGFSVQRSEFRAQTAGLPARNTKPSTLSSVPGSPWRIGQNVVHAKFGAGVIVSAEGAGAEARVQVNFRSTGLKWLMLEYAKLTSA